MSSQRSKKACLIIHALLALAGFCGHTVAGESQKPEAIGYTPLTGPNACLPDAAGFRHAYEVYQKTRGYAEWSRLLLVYVGDGNKGARAHAYCIFILEGKLWAYDQVSGSQRLWVNASDKDDAGRVGGMLSG